MRLHARLTKTRCSVCVRARVCVRERACVGVCLCLRACGCVDLMVTVLCLKYLKGFDVIVEA